MTVVCLFLNPSSLTIQDKEVVISCFFFVFKWPVKKPKKLSWSICSFQWSLMWPECDCCFGNMGLFAYTVDWEEVQKYQEQKIACWLKSVYPHFYISPLQFLQKGIWSNSVSFKGQVGLVCPCSGCSSHRSHTSNLILQRTRCRLSLRDISVINFRYYIFTEKSIKLSFTKEILLLSVTTAYTGTRQAQWVMLQQCQGAVWGVNPRSLQTWHDYFN